MQRKGHGVRGQIAFRKMTLPGFDPSPANGKGK